ncbi:hypothetical protein ACFQZZ_06660 [Nocardia sp. GCM10030253]|uniref:MmyB family transcriptional regulator n=1 Tax=Nocardia sp. GCM10030253 TaxID=3273404 RepID=UPI003627E478
MPVERLFLRPHTSDTPECSIGPKVLGQSGCRRITLCDGLACGLFVAGSETRRSHCVGCLRTAQARCPEDPDLLRLIAELRTGSERFDDLWRSVGTC